MTWKRLGAGIGVLLYSMGAWAADPAPRYLIQPVAGSDSAGDGGTALLAQIGAAEGIAADAAGNVYIADALDHRVRKVDSAGAITTLIGDGHPGYKGDGGPAVAIPATRSGPHRRLLD